MIDAKSTEIVVNYIIASDDSDKRNCFLFSNMDGVHFQTCSGPSQLQDCVQGENERLMQANQQLRCMNGQMRRECDDLKVVNVNLQNANASLAQQNEQLKQSNAALQCRVDQMTVNIQKIVGCNPCEMRAYLPGQRC